MQSIRLVIMAQCQRADQGGRIQEAITTMSADTKPIADQINTVREELRELEATLPEWPNRAGAITGSREYRAVAKRIVLSAKHLEELVKQFTFSR
jgi:hypothetical protein